LAQAERADLGLAERADLRGSPSSTAVFPGQARKSAAVAERVEVRERLEPTELKGSAPLLAATVPAVWARGSAAHHGHLERKAVTLGHAALWVTPATQGIQVLPAHPASLENLESSVSKDASEALEWRAIKAATGWLEFLAVQANGLSVARLADLGARVAQPVSVALARSVAHLEVLAEPRVFRARVARPEHLALVVVAVLGDLVALVACSG